MSTPCSRAGGGHRLGDGAHAADGVAPGALLAVHLAEHVVQQHIGGARRVGAGVVADDAVEAEGGLDRVALEPAVQPVAGRLREQRQQVALGGDVQLGELAAQGRALQQFGHRLSPAALDQVGRGLQHQAAQHVGDGLQPLAVGVEALGVLGGVLGHLGLGPALADQQVVLVVERQEVGDLALHHLQAVPGQVEVGDDLGIEQADRVAGRRVAEARVELLGHRRAADHVAALQHRHLEPGAGEVEGADEAVVAAADDDGVGLGRGAHRASIAEARAPSSVFSRRRRRPPSAKPRFRHPPPPSSPAAPGG